MLDDFSRYILAWKLRTTMAATDVTDTLQVALQVSGLDQVKVLHRPRLLSDNGPSYVSSELGEWLENKGKFKTQRRRRRRRRNKASPSLNGRSGAVMTLTVGPEIGSGLRVI